MRRESISHANREKPRVTPGLHVNMGVADDHSILGMHAIVRQYLQGSFGLGLFGGETVSAVDLRKEMAHPQRVDNGPRRDHRLIGQYRQFSWNAIAGALDRG